MIERWSRWYRSLGPLPVVAALAAYAVVVVVAAGAGGEPAGELRATLADLEPVHAGVEVRGRAARQPERLAVGDALSTDADGRARLRLDDGTVALVDRSTRLRVVANGLALEQGRIFVESGPGALSEVALSGQRVLLRGARAGFELKDGAAAVYAAEGELTLKGRDSERELSTGQSARWKGGPIEIAPERAFDDWTAGLAALWTVRGAPRRGVAELWGLGEQGAADALPLTIRSHAVRAEVGRESAHTRAETTFFNGGSQPVHGDLRVAIPEDAIVSRFGLERDGRFEEGRISLASRQRTTERSEELVLEWAGEGWLRGSIPSVPSGQTLKVVLEYEEWLVPRVGGSREVVQYRYPLVGDGPPPLVGEFSARVAATGSEPVTLAAGYGASRSGRAVELRRSDFRPAADLVVEIERAAGSGRARLYRAPARDDDREAGDTVMLRTELPRADGPEGVTLAVVVDSSGSVDPSTLDTERALVEAVLGGLGAKDRVVVFAADESVRPLGPPVLGPVNAARREAVASALASLVPGGGTDLGRALETAADALPVQDPAGIVLYVGDGWATGGDAGVAAIRARLERRAGGAPRLGAVAVGPLAHRVFLAALTRGSGPLFEAADGVEAARAATELVAETLRPVLTGVEVDLGPLVDRVYPRSPRSVPLGETFMAVGRVRGKLPERFVLRWRDARGRHERELPLELAKAANEDDVRRRWARERVTEILLDGRGREAATDVALRAGLLTPWTAFSAGAEHRSTPFALRLLDLSPAAEVALISSQAAAGAPLSAISEGGAATDDGEALEPALRAAAERVIDGAGASLRACRESRAALRPEVAFTLHARVDIGADGNARRARVRGAAPEANDEALNRCIEVVLSGLRYPGRGLGVGITIEHTIVLPSTVSSLGARRCSQVSRLPMPLRRGPWRELLSRASVKDVYVGAKRSCELGTWTDRRALLELALLAHQTGPERVQIARELEDAGESEAAAFLRREAARRAANVEELSAVRQALLAGERYPHKAFEKRYTAAADLGARLAVVRTFLELAPHDSRLRRRLVALLAALGDRSSLLAALREIRLDPFADAELLADVASALRAAGEDVEARRTFGEIAERAPRDPWVRGLLGDRLRREGWFEEATAAYQVLEELMPGDAAAALRLGLAHAAAGRTDLAGRLLLRVARTGGRSGDSQYGELAAHLASATVAEANRSAAGRPADLERLRRLALEIPRSARDAVVLVRAEAAAPPLEIAVRHGRGPALAAHGPEIAAVALGLYSVALGSEPAGVERSARRAAAANSTERSARRAAAANSTERSARRAAAANDNETELVLSRRAELSPARASKVRLDAIVPDGPVRPPRVVTIELELPADGKKVPVRWTADGWH